MEAQLPTYLSRLSQFELFYRYFETEESRYSQLSEKANIYLAVISGLSLFGGLNIGEIEGLVLGHWLTEVLAASCGLFVLMSLLAVVLSLRIFSYEDVCDVERLVVDIEEQKYDADDIYSVLLGNLAAAIANNRYYNDVRARYLEWCVASLGFAIASFLGLSVAAITLSTS
jgi:hypothetical protein